MTDLTIKSTRRLLLKGGLAAASIIGFGGRPAFAAKVSPGSVAYQASPKGDQNCAGCGLFDSPNSCKSVAGEISANGWCKLWKKA